MHLDLCQMPCWLGNPFRLGQQNLIPQQVFEKKMTCGCHSLEASNMFLETDLTVCLWLQRPRWLVYMMGALVGGHASAKVNVAVCV